MDLKLFWFVSLLLIAIGEGKVLNRLDQILRWSEIEEQMLAMAKDYIKSSRQELLELESFVDEFEKEKQTEVEPNFEDLQSVLDGEDAIESNPYINVASNPLLIYKMAHRLVTKVPKLQQVLLRENKGENALKGINLEQHQSTQFGLEDTAVLTSTFLNIISEILAAFSDTKGFTEDQLSELNLKWPGFGVYGENLPKKEDLDETLESLSILYDDYQSQSVNASVDAFALKLLPENVHLREINAYHAMQVSLKALQHGLHGNAIDWISYAWKRVSNEEIRDTSISKDLIEYTKDFIVKSHNVGFDFPLESFVFTKNYLNFYKERVSVAYFLDTPREKRIHSLVDVEETSKTLDSDELLIDSYYQLCTNGGALSKLYRRGKLKCYLDNKRHPYFLLRPLKVEQLSKAPKVLQFHDVLEEKEIEELERTTNTLPERYNPPGRIIDNLDGSRNIPNKTGIELDIASLSDEDNEIAITKLNWKVEVLTGLYSPKSLQSFAVSEFVAGRYTHLFQHNNTVVDKDNSSMTMGSIEFQLRTVEKGGETLYGLSGSLGVPIKGSAIYRETVFKNGTPRNDVYDGSCPVVRGSKLIITKSFQYFDQFLSFKCSLDANE